MQRRTFVRIALGLVIGPSAAAAQPKGKIYRIGVLSIANRPHGPAMEAFRRGLREHGHVEGQTFVIEYRAAGDTPERYQDLVAELVRLSVDVIVAQGTPPALAASMVFSIRPTIESPSTRCSGFSRRSIATSSSSSGRRARSFRGPRHLTRR